ncbi:unnamed protein product [Caenorhabditis angaria]|uniref:MAM domain-containing protein n=1 Tax=Caenorhabditis angaria TaxID=860376 RepID=A0A9P1IU35_9PELO|nr:unnamed protein product [Caenorhabditis angaria]
MDRLSSPIDLDYSEDFKCAAHPSYSSQDIRSISSIIPFSEMPHLSINDGGKATCSFDDEMEFCGWHNAQDTVVKFWKAYFDQNFDMDRFDCTSVRKFDIDRTFLLAGGEPILSPQKAAIETEIPCQYGDSVIRFDFWANTLNPILRFCLSHSAEITCQDILPMPNPVNFSVPMTGEPITVRIEIVNLQENDIILIDNLYYDGQICEVVEDENVPKLLPTLSTVSIPQLITGSPDTAFFDDDTSTEQTTSNVHFSELSPCSALTCNFNDGDSCFYGLSGIGSTSSWQISDKLTGNRHTGIQRINLDDQKKVGYAFVGSDTESNINNNFVMESPKFTMTQNIIVSFDIYVRSISPQLKVCIDNFDDCQYTSPPVQKNKFWHSSQNITIPEGSKKLFFVVQNVGKHQFLAIDNIKLKTIDGDNFCE